MESVVIFAKTPLVGRVKTRLAPRLGPLELTALAGAFLTDSVAALQLLANIDVRVALPDEDPRQPMREILGPAVPILPQGPGDLGDRLRRVTAAELSRDVRAVAVVGADHPTLPGAMIRRCLDAARPGRAAWVLTEDGGFAALALARPAPTLFRDVPWSAPGVAEAVRANARRSGVELVDCGRWYDVDTPEDLDRLAAELAGSPDACPATRAVLDGLDPPLHAGSRRTLPTGGDS